VTSNSFFSPALKSGATIQNRPESWYTDNL